VPCPSPWEIRLNEIAGESFGDRGTDSAAATVDDGVPSLEKHGGL
jgi:hypothetical protein